MAKQFMPTIKKLQRAINLTFDKKILINKTQFYSKETKSVKEIIIIKQAVYNEEKDKIVNIELFSSASDIQILLWLRDYWFELNGWEIPTDNEIWNEAKQKYYDKQEKKNYQSTKSSKRKNSPIDN